MIEGFHRNIQESTEKNSEIGKSEVSEARELPDKAGELIESDNLPDFDDNLEAGDNLKAGEGFNSNEYSENVANYADSPKQKDIEESCYSTYEERLKQVPAEGSERGEWKAERGESKFIPNDQEIKEILGKHGLDGITYKDGIPDFSQVSEATVKIDKMTENRAENFKQCDEMCAKQWNREARDERTDWTPRDGAQWRKENGYSWHERNDMETCDLVPTRVNDYFGHLGGVSECKKRDAINDGGDFDE
jgi:hypothetical protein